MTARASPKPALMRWLELTVTMPVDEGLAVTPPVPAGAVMRVCPRVVVGFEPPVTAAAVVAVAVTGTRPTELALPVPVVKTTLGTVMAVLTMTVELELEIVEPAESVQGTTVVATTVTVV
jgi:hypothetical protein